MFNLTLTTSSSLPPAPFFITVVPWLDDELPFTNSFLTLDSMDFLLMPFLVAVTFFAGFSILACRRLLLFARADSAPAAPLTDKDASDMDGDGGVPPRENVTERLLFADVEAFFFCW